MSEKTEKHMRRSVWQLALTQIKKSLLKLLQKTPKTNKPMKTKESKDRREEGKKEAREQSRRTEKQHHPEKRQPEGRQEEKQAHDEDLPGEKAEIRIEHQGNVQAEGSSGNREKRKDELPPTEETESFSSEQQRIEDTRTDDKDQGKEGTEISTEEKEIDVELDVQKDKVEIEASRSSNKTDAPGNEVDVNVSMDKNELHINISMQKPTGEEGNKEKPAKKKKDNSEKKDSRQ